MRLTSIIGIAIVVVLVVAVAALTLRTDSDDQSSDVTPIITPGEETSSGQFFQAVPAGQEDVVVSASPTAGAVAEKVPITMDETGFTPATVTVAVGSQVTFVNNGQAQHWPASAVHPTHSVLPGFDAKRGLGTGETYSYTFDESGTWHCHDHLIPQFTCTINVE